jgi:tetratricopeptide (TPR) repeat protein
MARFEKSSTKRPGTDAAVAAPKRARKQKQTSYEDTMFFPRLRRHAKWMFVLLAVFMGGGFVIFGVGAGGVGVGDVLRGGGGGRQSVSDARKETEKSPENALAWRDLSTALQADGQTDEAVDALATAGRLAPKDVSIQRELASLYITQAGDRQLDAQLAQAGAATGAATWNFPASLLGGQGQYVLEDPIGRSVNAVATAKATEALTAASAAARNAVDAYKAVAKLQPDDPNVQLELASTAQQVGDTQTTIAAYKAFLRLAPDDPNATAVRQQLKQLERSSAPSSG